MYIHGLPGSSPISRSDVNDLKYQQKYGKGPLIERAERLKRLHEIQNNLAIRREQSAAKKARNLDMYAVNQASMQKLGKDQRVKRVGVAKP